MPRSKSAGLTISQLESLLSRQRSQLDSLTSERTKAQTKVDAIDAQIRKLNGGVVSSKPKTPTPGTAMKKTTPAAGSNKGRVRNSVSLIASMENVLRAATAAMSVGDIMAGVLSAGYKTTSANFRGIVNQTLIKEKQFSSTGRGMYEMKQ